MTKIKKEFTITYKFSDIIDNIEAETEEEARRIADERLESDNSPQIDTYCYEAEIEEVKE